MQNLKFVLIGLSDQVKNKFSKAESNAMDGCFNFAGGHRHQTLVGHLLPAHHHWENIDVPLKPFIDKVKHVKGDWVVFASGDPLFFGIANTLKRECPEAQMTVIPAFNAIQMLAHQLIIPYGQYQTVTLTGRRWNKFDEALIRQVAGMGILTDRVKTPAAIAQRMLEYGYYQYQIHVGERLGSDHQRIRTLTVEEAAISAFEMPNVLFVVRIQNRQLQKAIPDKDFIGLDGRPKMITKMPIRMTSLMLMQLHNRQSLWDVGACTGSISIEAKLMAPHLDVVAFEKREERRHIIQRNSHNFGAPGIQIFIDDFQNIDKENLTRPDAVFLGGYGGVMEQILDEIDQWLIPRGCIVFNAVTQESLTRFQQWHHSNHYLQTAKHTITVDEHNSITIVAIEKPTAILTQTTIQAT